MTDGSNGYEAVARDFIAARLRNPAIGVATIREWAATVRPNGSVLDLGCGSGFPITEVLIESGFDVYAVDASPAMVDAFRARFPNVPVECTTAQVSNFFGRTFDGILAWGLMFLLEAEDQEKLIAKVSRALNPDGRFVFTAPSQVCEWVDVMTGEPSRSLGVARYRRLLERESMVLIDESVDEGENHYYFAMRI